jgi:methionyl-tRNA formyltransferase
MGGKYPGCGCLKYLIDKKFQVVACFINKSDTAKDRWFPSAAELCLDNNIPVYFYEDVNSLKCQKKIKSLSPDIIVVVYYDQILKKNIINLAPCGCVNLHLALSQVHRGCYPTTWNLIRGDKYAGVTLHYIVEKIDAGPVIAQKKLKIRSDWTGKDLYYRVSDLGIKLFKEVFPQLNRAKPYKLDLTKSKYYKREFPSFEIKLDKETHNRVRAMIFDPFSRPYIKIGKRKLYFKD